MTKLWLVSKRDRQCRHCDSEAKAAVDATGNITSTCASCNTTRTRQSHEYYENRACKRCGWLRRVTAHVGYSAGLTSDQVWAREVCDACELEQSAARHYATSRRLLAKAASIRAARLQKRNAGLKPTS